MTSKKHSLALSGSSKVNSTAEVDLGECSTHNRTNEHNQDRTDMMDDGRDSKVRGQEMMNDLFSRSSSFQMLSSFSQPFRRSLEAAATQKTTASNGEPFSPQADDIKIVSDASCHLGKDP